MTALRLVRTAHEGVSEIDVRMMERAIGLARQAALAGEVPIAAVVYRGEEVLGEAANNREAMADPTGHAEIVAMRERVRHAHAVGPGQFDVKHSAGGMIDVEFAVQLLVLSQASQHPELLENAGNIALLERAEAAGLLAPGLGHVGDLPGWPWPDIQQAQPAILQRGRNDEVRGRRPVEHQHLLAGQGKAKTPTTMSKRSLRS